MKYNCGMHKPETFNSGNRNKETMVTDLTQQ